jgi:ketosteroid isomerase-like protein
MAIADVDRLAQAFHDGVAQRDAAAVAGLYAENGRFLPPGMPPAEGPVAIQSAIQLLLDMGAESIDIEPVDVREAGELTIEYGRYVLVIRPAGAEALTDEGKYVVVHESQPDGTTKILLDIFNSNAG